MSWLIIIIALIVLCFCSNTIGEFVIGHSSGVAFCLGFIILIALIVVGVLLGVFISKRVQAKGKNASKLLTPFGIITGVSAICAVITFIKNLSSIHPTGQELQYNAFTHKYVVVNTDYVSDTISLFGNINMFLVFVLFGLLIGLFFHSLFTVDTDTKEEKSIIGTKSVPVINTAKNNDNSTNGITGERTRMDRVTATIAGTVLDSYVNVGDIIKPGTKICTIEFFGTTKDVYSKAGGEVLSIDVSIGSNVSNGDTLAYILYKE